MNQLPLLHWDWSLISLSLQAGSCNVTAECSRIAVDLVQLHISEDADVLCLLNVGSPIGALAINRSCSIYI